MATKREKRLMAENKCTHCERELRSCEACETQGVCLCCPCDCVNPPQTDDDSELPLATRKMWA